MLLAGDVGGTKTNIGYFGIRNGSLVSVAEETYINRHYQNLNEIIRRFIARDNLVATSLCFGVAGPVRDGRCEVSNLPWLVDTESIRNETGIPRVHLINDLEATAHAIDVIDPKYLVELTDTPTLPNGNRAVIAAGTGLGEACLYWDGARHRPFASEGGHACFSPRDRFELSLAEYIIETYGHASWERVLSGPGLVNIYHYLALRNQFRVNATVAELVASDGAAAITAAAINKNCEICEQALNVFVSLYGAEAGNLALKMYATGGVYIAGGIAAKIIKKLQEPAFLEAFVSKGRLRKVLESIPVRVIMTNRAALIGAAAYAHKHSSRNMNTQALDQINPFPHESTRAGSP